MSLADTCTKLESALKREPLKAEWPFAFVWLQERREHLRVLVELGELQLHAGQHPWTGQEASALLERWAALKAQGEAL